MTSAPIRAAQLFVTLLALCSTVSAQSKVEHEDDEINRKRLEWFWGQRAFPQGTVPHELRLRAIREMERMMPKGTSTLRPRTGLSTTAWTSIGPQPIGPNNYNSFDDAGRVWALAVDPGNPAIVYAGTDGGGVWKTTDSGATWTPLTDQQPSLGIASLAIDPANSSIILAGTGGSAAYAAGILKSTNGGASWTQITGPFLPYYNGIEGPAISSIAINPANDQIVLAALSYTGIYRSSDGGNTWTQVLAANTLQDPSEVLFDPSNSNIAYTGVSGAGLYKSTDGGQTWTLFNGSGSTALPLASMGAIDIAVAPSASGTVYAALKQSSNNLLLGFYKTTDGGNTWNQIGAPSDDNIPYWNWSLRVHPTNPNVLYAGSLVIHQSLDGGATWSDSFPTYIHVDHHAQAFSADGSVLYVGSDGGVWSTNTPSTASTAWNNLNAGFATILFYPGLSISPTDVHTSYGGTQDNGTLQFSGSAVWDEVECGDGAWTAIDFTNPETVYTSCSSSNTWVWKYSNGAWASAVNGFNLNDRSDFILPLVMDPSNSQRLYLPTYRVYQTNDGAATWTAISPDLTAANYDVLTTVAAAPSDSNTVYAGSASGYVSVTRNATSGAAATWTKVNSGLPQRSVTQLAVSPTNSQNAYVTLSGFSYYDNGGHIWVTTNAGGSWSNVTGNLPDVPVNDLVIDPDTAGTLYAATDIGVFRSLDAGTSWLPFGTGLPYVVVNSLKLHEASRTLRAATYGRGAWDILVTAANQVNITIGANVTGAPFVLDGVTTYAAPITFAWTIGSTHTVDWSSTAASAPGSRYLFQNWSDVSTANPRTITVTSSAAAYTANLTAQYLLTLVVSPAGTGTLTANPTSTDGYYNSGTSVTLTATPVSGYSFWYFQGLSLDYPSPQTAVLSAPLTVTANFLCSFTPSYYPPYQTGAGATGGFLQWQTAPGCSWTLSSDSAWLTVGPPTSGSGSLTAPFAIAQNTGAARTGTVTLKTSVESIPYTINQSDATVDQPSNASLSPTSSSANAQVFIFQFYDPSGYANIAEAEVNFGVSPSDQSCLIYYYSPKSLYLMGNQQQSTLTLPTSSSVQNAACMLSGAGSSASGSGDTLTIKLAVTAQTATPGLRSISTWAYDSGGEMSSYTTLAGFWTPVGACGVNGALSVVVSDVQRVLNEALGLAAPTHDLTGDGVVNVADAQIVINAALGMGCM